MTINCNFPGQFLLTKGIYCRIANYGTYQLGNWFLQTDLPVCNIADSSGRLLGWIIGWAISGSSGIVSGSCNALYLKENESFEEHIYQYGGRFAALLITGEKQHAYLDAAGTLALTYTDEGFLTSEAVAVASTPGLLALAGGREAVHAEIKPNNFLPAGLTADPAVKRLLPNHYLDLSLGIPFRHHLFSVPRRIDQTGIPTLVKLIFQVLREKIAGVTSNRQAPVALTLTAGQDSRMVLAAAGSVLTQLQVITFDYPAKPGDPDKTAYDVATATEICRILGLEQLVLPVADINLAERQEYLERIGYCGAWGKAKDFLVACRNHFNHEWPLISGFGGELGRCFYQKALGHRKFIDSPQGITKLLRIPEELSFLTAIEKWLDSFSYHDLEGLLDMVYLELRLGCWMGPQTYGFSNSFFISPFIHRSIIDKLFQLPVDYRLRQQLAQDIIDMGLPEISGIPFNE